MPNKKITVVGEGVEQPLTPEEEQRIEVKIDAMLDPNLPDKPDVAPTPVADKAPVDAVEAVPAEVTKPKVTKIVTTFADEPDAPEVVEKPKPVAKKILIKHHDDEEAEKPEEAEVVEPKAEPVHVSKPKPAGKKPLKKKVALTDGSAQPDDLAAAITASALAAEESIVHKPVAMKISIQAAEPDEPDEVVETVEEAEPVTEISEVETAEELPESNADESGGAPPLIHKHDVAPIGTTDVAPVEEAVTAKKIAVFHDDPVEADEDELITLAGAMDGTDDEDDAPPEVTVEEPEEVTEQVLPVSKPEAPSASTVQKYQPPAGPLQFKRAEVPIQPHKPGEPRPVEASASELSEDAALAKAFETPKTERKPKVRTGRSGLRVATLVIIILVVGSLAAVAALPTLRHKALNLVDVDTAAPQTSVVQTPVVAAATTPLAQDVYVSKRAGIFNIYRASSDAQSEQLVLAGTGDEETDLVLAPNAAATTAALISTRDGKENSAGDLQQSLTLVNVADGKLTNLDTADSIKLVDWFGNKIVYVLRSTTTSTKDPNRYQIISYDTTSKVRTILDHANYLNDVLAAKGTIYYATAASTTGGGQFMAIKPDATGKQVVLSAEVAAITRTSYDQLTLSTVDKWYSYTLGASKATATNNVSQQLSRLYVDSPDGKHSAYISDSKLISLDIATGKETAIAAAKPSYPLRWLSDDTIVYRDSGADYSIKLGTAQPTKIVDVPDVAGVSLWHQ